MEAFSYSDPDGLQELTELLDDTCSIRQLEADFRSRFRSLPEQFQVGCALCIMIKQGVLSLNQRIAAIAILCDVFRLADPPRRFKAEGQHEVCNHNPFVAFLFEYLSSLHGTKGGDNAYEVKFLIHVLTAAGGRESLLRTTAEVQQQRHTTSWLDTVDMEQLRAIHNINTHYSKETQIIERAMQHIAAEAAAGGAGNSVVASSTTGATQTTAIVGVVAAPAATAAVSSDHPLKQRFLSALTTALTPSQQNSLVAAIKASDGPGGGFLKKVKFEPAQVCVRVRVRGVRFVHLIMKLY
jgi:hypothetical protein